MKLEWLLLAGAVLACSSSSSDGNGAGGSPGAGGGGGSSGSEICDAVRANYQTQCATYADGAYKTCQQGFLKFEPIGCGKEIGAYEACKSTATLSDCASGADPCASEQTAYFACQSQFTQSTGCSILGAQSYCTNPKPYAFGCLGDAPAGCVPAPVDGSAANIQCCSSFAK